MNVSTMTRRLEEGGFTQEQAMALAEVMREEVLGRIATKEDLRLLANGVSEDVGHLSERLGRVESRLDRVEGRLEHLDQKIDRVTDALDQKIDRVSDALDQKIDRVSDALGQQIDRVKDELKEYVNLVVGETSARLEKMIHQENKATVKWVAGIIVVQTVALLTSVIGLVKFLT